MPGIQGVYAAAVTPRGKRGDVDFGAAFELVDFLGRAGVAGLALFTGAGEYAALACDERSRLAYLAAKRSRVPVLVSVGSATLDDSVRLARDARDAGAEALLLPPPYFYSYRQDDIREYYLQFASHVESGTSTLLSNHPAHASAIDSDTVRELFATRHFAGIEDASSDVESFARIRAAADGPACVLSGNDSLLKSAIHVGAHGAISAMAGAVPELVIALERAVRAGNAEESARLDSRVQEFMAWRQEFPEPAILKVAAAQRGLKTGALLVPLSAAKQRRLEEFREWFQGWLPNVKKLSASASRSF